MHESFSASFDGENVFDDGETVFAIKISGGIDKPIKERWDIRAGAGYILGFHEGSNINIFRLFVGVVRKL